MTPAELMALHTATAQLLAGRFGADLADDAASEAVCRFVAVRGAVAWPGGWIFLTARNYALNEIRRRRGERNTAERRRQAGHHESEEGRADDRELVLLLLDRLTPGQKAIARGIMDAEPAAETAERLGVAPSTVRARRHQLKKKLHAHASRCVL